MKEKKLKNLRLRQGLQRGMTRGRNIIKKTDLAEDLEVALKKLNPKEISIAVLGNHDHWMGADKIREILKNVI
jgi:predicted MPP superfamily phosphohydrolase